MAEPRFRACAPRLVLRTAAFAMALLAGLAAMPVRADEAGLDAAIGKALFKRPWVPAPSSTRANDGLGPLFDARSCAACHPGSGRGSSALDATGRPEGLGLVLSLFREDGSGDPVYGHRLETMTLPGVPAEGVLVADVEQAGRRVPRIVEPGYGPLDPATHVSLRLAPDLRGRGGLERVDDATILALEDPQDRDRDGVRGHARRLDHPEGGSSIGRFGWKASHATLESQTSEAFSLDLGLSTPLRLEPWGDCTAAQAACRNAPHGQDAEGAPEIPHAIVSRIVTYLRDVEAPNPPRDARGERLFAATGCAACHRPSLPTRDGGSVALFTDVLLHDMGAGLADSGGVPGAEAGEWRTAPLAGLSQALAQGGGLLHDGRAADVTEAVRWHDGEAAGARARFDALDPGAKRALIDYVSSL